MRLKKDNEVLKKSTYRAGTVSMILILSLLLCACGNSSQGQNNSDSQDGSQGNINTGYVVTGPDSYDSADMPVITSINSADSTITFLNLDLEKKYTLSYDGTTKFFNKYGESIALSQINVGDVVDVTFLKSKKHLTTMKLSSGAWQYENVEKYEFNTVKREVSIGNEVYKLSDKVLYLSEGQVINEMELNAADVLSFQGVDTTVLSVTVEKGHGYLRLANSESFVGGWIEIGQAQIQRITEDMLIPVPEGSYQVSISYKGSGGIKDVVINRDEESVLDIGDLKIEEPRTGTVLFSLTPSDATLYIDGAEVDTSQPIVLEYGIHQLIARAEGYQSLTQYLRVGEESAGVNIVLEKATAHDSDSTDSSTSTTVDTLTDYFKVYIDAPEKAEVYLDGSYVGISPCSFKKKAGTHVITLSRTGYETKSYTVQIDDEDKDVNYSFANLEPTGIQSVDSLVSDALNSVIND